MDGLAAMPNNSMERAGYRFLGWYDGLKKWNFEKDTVTKDITLTAKWEKYLSFMPSNDGSDGLWVVGCGFDVENVVIPREYSRKQITGINMGFADRKNIIKDKYIFDISYEGKKPFGVIFKDDKNPKAGVYKEIWQSPRDYAEKLRLFYVAISRAKSFLYLTS